MDEVYAGIAEEESKLDASPNCAKNLSAHVRSGRPSDAVSDS